MILRGYTSVENTSRLQSSELTIEVKVSKDHRAVFLIEIVNKDFNDFNGKVSDTIQFLRTNYSQLVDLKNKMPVMSWEIDYGYNTKVATGELAVEGLLFPLEILKLCSELKIEILLSLYDGNLFE